MSEVIVSGTFKNEPELQRTISSLTRSGISPSNISFVKTPKLPGKAFDLNKKTKTATGMAAGMLVCGFIGAVFCFFRFSASLANAAGDIVLVGPWPAALIGFAIGSLFGALIGGIAGHRLPVYQAEMSEAQHENSLLLGVSVEQDQVERVDALLKEGGAGQVSQLDKRYQAEVGL